MITVSSRDPTWLKPLISLLCRSIREMKYEVIIPFCPLGSGVSQLIAIAVELIDSIDTFLGGKDGTACVEATIVCEVCKCTLYQTSAFILTILGHLNRTGHAERPSTYSCSCSNDVGVGVEWVKTRN